MVNNPIALYDLKRTMPTSKCKDIYIIKEKIDRNNIYLLCCKEVLMSKMTEQFYCKDSE